MNQGRRQALQRLAELSDKDIGDNENKVKYKFIIPFLESFGHSQQLDFEHSAQGNRIDILIGSDSGHNIVIEAKSYGKNLDDCISQLKRYCDKKRPILAIISNGEEIRFYSPFWSKPDFTKTLIYSIQRHQLSDDAVIEKIESVLAKEFLQNGSIEKHIEEREKEIDRVNEERQLLDSSAQEKIKRLTDQRNILEEEFKSIQSQIESNKKEVADLRQKKKQEIQGLEEKHHILLSQSEQQIPTVSPQPRPSGSKRPLGRRGHDHLSDYLIPVIHLIKNGMQHTKAFHQIAKELDVTYQTVNDRCARSLNISTDKFVELIKTNGIKSFLKEKFPDQVSLIEQQL